MAVEGTNIGSLTDLQCKTIKTSVNQQHPGSPQAPHIVYICGDRWSIVDGQVLHNTVDFRMVVQNGKSQMA